ncbi:hypothetical protein CY35_02G133100 [Sphagnum magellanicum]|nr:hypothetical protein CY35_02G133100 [Sphagnum magellanicum]KAH9572176.1 hypothetical protein CY35_02G133100 [Sphagnum magellanicum]
MRNHGWELPYHPLQTVAIAVFAGLGFSFYLFFIPFVGSSILKFHIYAAFSPLVLALVILYVWCAACDPADPGVHHLRRAAESKKLAAKGKAAKESVSSDTGLDQSQYDSDRSLSLTFPLKNEDASGGSIFSSMGGCLCSLVHKKLQDSEMFYSGEQLVYCSICDAEISKNSKHCRACDKCVAGFDHHCRWLNNCVGRKNYRLFVASMLVIVWATGILVLVRCFSHRDNFDEEITASLGSSFSRVPYIAVVGSLTLLAFSATVPLTQLFIFHIILIQKGITTYDYILAVRDQEQGLVEGDGLNSMTSSPASSTGVSSYSSTSALALQQAMLCTPPRMFVEHQQTVLPYSSDLEASGGKLGRRGGGTLQGQKKVSVGINPWKLAHISAEEAIRAAARAREGSSIFGPNRYSQGPSHITETEESSLNSSCSVSGEISVVASHAAHRKYAAYVSGKEWWPMMKEHQDKIIPEGALGAPFGPRFSQKPRSPFAGHHERMLLKCSPSRFSGELRTYPGGRYPGSPCTESHLASPDGFHNSPDLQLLPHVLLARSVAPNSGLGKVLLERSRSDGYEASVGESGDENSMLCQQPTKAWIKTRLHRSLVRPTEKGATWEDSPEDFMPRWSWGSRSLGSKGSRSSKAESSGGHTSGGSRAEANILKHVKKEWPGLPNGLCISSDNSCSSSPSRYNSPQQNSSNFLLTGDSSSLSKTPDKKEVVSVCNGPSVSLTSKAMPGTKPLRSTQRLMDSILQFNIIRPPLKSTNKLLEPTS